MRVWSVDTLATSLRLTDRPLVRDTPGVSHEFRAWPYGSIAFLACH